MCQRTCLCICVCVCVYVRVCRWASSHIWCACRVLLRGAPYGASGSASSAAASGSSTWGGCLRKTHRHRILLPPTHPTLSSSYPSIPSSFSLFLLLPLLLFSYPRLPPSIPHPSPSFCCPTSPIFLLLLFHPPLPSFSSYSCPSLPISSRSLSVYVDWSHQLGFNGPARQEVPMGLWDEEGRCCCHPVALTATVE